MQAKARSRGPLDAGVEAERVGDVEQATSAAAAAAAAQVTGAYAPCWVMLKWMATAASSGSSQEQALKLDFQG